MFKRISAILLSIVLCLTMFSTAFAVSDSGARAEIAVSGDQVTVTATGLEGNLLLCNVLHSNSKNGPYVFSHQLGLKKSSNGHSGTTFMGDALAEGTDFLKIEIPVQTGVLAQVDAYWPQPVESVSLDKGAETVKVNDTITLTATVLPANAADQTVSWSTTNGTGSVDIHDNGDGTVTVTGKTVGTATVTVTTTDGGFTASCTITVNPAATVNVTGVTLDKTSETLAVGDTLALRATVSPSNATNQAVTWNTSNPSVATVTNGTVTALREGTATITVTTADGLYTAACTITVTPAQKPPVPPTPPVNTYTVTAKAGSNGKLTPASQTVNEGESVTFTADPDSRYKVDTCTVDPAGAAKVSVSGNTVTVSNVTADCTLNVTFTRTSSGSSGSHGGGGGAATPGTAVSVGSTGGHGTVSTSPKNPVKGSKVTLTVKPHTGYVLDSITVKDASGKEVELTKLSDTKYTFTMPASRVTVDADFISDGSAPAQTGTVGGFVDVSSGAYYADAVAWAVAGGITSGTTATTFSPDNTCTRAQTVTFLWRAAGSPAPASTNNPFTDVTPGAYYYNAVLWAVEKGITSGTTKTTFSPDNTVTRGQTVTFLYRTAGSPAVGGGAAFADVADSAYYADAVAWAAANGITGGTTATTFSPANGCTRAQIVTFLYRYMA